MQSKIALFKGKKIRRVWDESEDKWYFSVVDIVGVLTDSADARDYWYKMKIRVKTEDGFELSTVCRQLKLVSTDGKKYITDCADTEAIFRIIQSIPSPKAEPFKQWLAKVGYERVEETHDPELAINRALRYYLKKGYSKDWINQRLKSIEIRKGLTDEWETGGVKEGKEFAELTDIITLAWAGMTTKGYKKFKDLKKESLRDNMTNLELVLNMLAEAATTEISQKEEPVNLSQNKIVAKRGGGVAKAARNRLEKETGRKVISPLNFRTQKNLKAKN